MLEFLRILLYNMFITKEVLFNLTIMSSEGIAHSDNEIDYVGAIDDCQDSFMVSHRLWETFESYGLHFHRFYEILIHRRNGGRFVIGRDAYDMKPNTFYVVAPHQLHDIISDEPLHQYERICVYITEATLNYAGMSLVPMLELINSACVNHQNCFSLTDDEYDRIDELTRKIHRKFATDHLNIYEELEDKVHLTLILSVLCKVMERGRQLKQQGHISPLILQIINHISENYVNAITLDSIALEFNISKYYLSHEFAKAMGTSVYQYLLVCRINAAKQMILTGEAITSVAFRCGFNDYSSFLRAFDKVMGESPSAFRKRYIGAVGRKHEDDMQRL